MPINYKEYHPKWSLISRLIRYRRAKNKCEWCGIKNQTIIEKRNRKPIYGILLHTFNKYKTKFGKVEALRKLNLTQVVLTVAHIDQDKTNNRFNNLAALCQKCHLGHDRKQHEANRKYGREHKAKHQLVLDLETEKHPSDTPFSKKENRVSAKPFQRSNVPNNKLSK